MANEQHVVSSNVMLADLQMCVGGDDQAQGVDSPTNNVVVQLALSIFVVNMLSKEIDEANTIHPNDGWSVQRKNGNIQLLF